MTDTHLPSVALLVVDMQDSFLRAIPEADILLDRCAFAVEAAKLLGIRTYFTEQVPEKLGPVNAGLLDLCDSPAVFSKTAFSALQAPGLREVLTPSGIDHLILAGIEIPICVYQTVIEAANSDFSMTLLSDCIGGRREQDRQPVIDALARIGCHVLPSEAVFYSILGGAENDAFKAFTALVKKYNPQPSPREA